MFALAMLFAVGCTKDHHNVEPTMTLTERDVENGEDSTGVDGDDMITDDEDDAGDGERSRRNGN